FALRFALAIEKLHYRHTSDVFLQESIDPRDGRTDSAVGVAHLRAENQRGEQHERQWRKRRDCQFGIEMKEEGDEEDQQHEIIQHRHDTGGEEIVERVDVRGYASDQAAHGTAIVEAHRQALQVHENFAAQVVHNFLPHALHHAHLHVLKSETQ